MDLNEVKKTKIYKMVEVSDFMGVSYITLYRMVKDGRIKAINIAKSGTKPIYGFTAEAVQAYYDSIGGKENIRKRNSKGDSQVPKQAT